MHLGSSEISFVTVFVLFLSSELCDLLIKFFAVNALLLVVVYLECKLRDVMLWRYVEGE
jgi:hypothetical protein